MAKDMLLEKLALNTGKALVKQAISPWMLHSLLPHSTLVIIRAHWWEWSSVKHYAKGPKAGLHLSGAVNSWTALFLPKVEEEVNSSAFCSVQREKAGASLLLLMGQKGQT